MLDDIVDLPVALIKGDIILRREQLGMSAFPTFDCDHFSLLIAKNGFLHRRIFIFVAANKATERI